MAVMSANPLVSIGMSVYNNEQTVRRALASMVRQTFKDWELILFDDCSTDATVKVAQSFDDERIRLICDHERRGLAYRLNQAVDMARGVYFARMDGDDVSLPERLARQVAFLDDYPEVDLLGSGVVVFAENGIATGVRIPLVSHEAICRQPWSGFPLPHPTWMGRIEWFRHHRYDERFYKSQDYDLLLRSYKNSCFAAIPEVLLGYCEGPMSRKKSISSRCSTVKSQWQYARKNKAWIMLPRSFAGQFIKGTIDFALIGTRFEQKILNRRNSPIDQKTLHRWRIFWEKLQEI